MSETVTFRGSRNTADGTTTVVLPAEGDFEGLTFDKDVPVRDVPVKVIERLQTQMDLKLFIFDVGEEELVIAEPYDGYDDAKVPDIIKYLESAPVPEFTAVKNYEAANKERKTILEYEQPPQEVPPTPAPDASTSQPVGPVEQAPQ